MNSDMSITPSIVMEYLYCPRYIYYMLVLQISQKAGQRYKVKQGSKVHQRKTKINKQYLRKKIGVEEKHISQRLSSSKHNLHGVVDEVLLLDDGTAAPLDYKFAKYKGRLFKTYRYQAVMYSMLINDNYDLEVNRAYLVYTRSNNKLLEMDIKQEDQERVTEIIEEVMTIINKGYYPEGTQYEKRCSNCCYNNICVK